MSDNTAIDGAENLGSLAFEHLPVATIYTERRAIRRANPAFAKLFELERGRIEGLGMDLFYPLQEESERLAAMREGNSSRRAIMPMSE